MNFMQLFYYQNISKIKTCCVPYLSFYCFAINLNASINIRNVYIKNLLIKSTWLANLVANSTPIVLLLSKLNSFRVKRDNKLDLPTPESPIKTTLKKI